MEKYDSIHFKIGVHTKGLFSKDYSIWGCIDPFLALWWSKMNGDGWNLWFPNIYPETFCSITLKFSVYTYFGESPEVIPFWDALVQFRHTGGQKLTEYGGFWPYRKTNLSINFKFGVFICWVSCWKWLNFGSHWANFIPLVYKKVTENGVFFVHIHV